MCHGSCSRFPSLRPSRPPSIICLAPPCVSDFSAAGEARQRRCRARHVDRTILRPSPFAGALRSDLDDLSPTLVEIVKFRLIPTVFGRESAEFHRCRPVWGRIGQSGTEVGQFWIWFGPTPTADFGPIPTMIGPVKLGRCRHNQGRVRSTASSSANSGRSSAKLGPEVGQISAHLGGFRSDFDDVQAEFARQDFLLTRGIWSNLQRTSQGGGATSV